MITSTPTLRQWDILYPPKPHTQSDAPMGRQAYRFVVRDAAHWLGKFDPTHYAPEHQAALTEAAWYLVEQNQMRHYIEDDGHVTFTLE